jgi:lipoprotein-anchoring transpeptidase ErfK/SrfK
MTRPVAILALAAALAAPAAALGGSGSTTASFPAAGELRVDRLVVRAAPSATAPAITTLHMFRPDYRRQIVFAETAVRGGDGRLWFRVRLTKRPNGTLGFVPAATVQTHPVANRILVRRGARRLEVWKGRHLLFRTVVAVGAPGMETPLGRFYVTARFVPDDSFLGSFAVETSAYSRLSEWPGGGVVGIHGTSMPWLLGQAVSHGCIRVSNDAALRLRALAPLGTPITIVAS